MNPFERNVKKDMDRWMILSVVAAILAVYAMIDVLRLRMSRKRKIIWFTVVVILPLVGPIIYFVKRRSIATNGVVAED